MSDYDNEINLNPDDEMRYYKRQYEHHMTPVTIAMIGNQQMRYDAATTTYLETKEEKWQYIGAGYIYSINGIKQLFGPDDVMHFWVHK